MQKFTELYPTRYQAEKVRNAYDKNYKVVKVEGGYRVFDPFDYRKWKAQK